MLLKYSQQYLYMMVQSNFAKIPSKHYGNSLHLSYLFMVQAYSIIWLFAQLKSIPILSSFAWRQNKDVCQEDLANFNKNIFFFLRVDIDVNISQLT